MRQVGRKSTWGERLAGSYLGVVKNMQQCVNSRNRWVAQGSNMAVKAFTSEYLGSLVAQARSSPRLRQNRNIHEDYADPCQRLFNAIEPESYIQPHRHGVVPRAETMFAVRGSFALVEFSGSGEITGVVRFGVDDGSARISAGVEVPPGCWHTVLALQEGSVLLEVKAGPFDPVRPKELAPWAPDEGAQGVAAYLNQLRRAIETELQRQA